MITTTETKNGLRLTIGNEGRAELSDALRDGYDRAESPVAEWFPDYAVKDPWQALAWRGRVEFVKAGE